MAAAATGRTGATAGASRCRPGRGRRCKRATAPTAGMGTATAATATPVGTVLDELKQCDDGAQGESRERAKRGGSKWDKREAGAGVWCE